MNKKLLVITGATSGIGKEAVIEIAKKEFQIVILSRNIEKGNAIKEEIILQTGNSDIEIMECDLASFESIKKFSNKFKKKYNKLDVLVNNAGVWEKSEKKSVDNVEMVFAVNYLAPFLLTNLLLNELKNAESAKIINTASALHQGSIDFDNLEEHGGMMGFKVYRKSKLAILLFTRLLADKLKNTNITVNAVHPGFVATNIDRNIGWFMQLSFKAFAKSPKKGSEVLVFAILSDLTTKFSGQFFIANQIAETSNESKDLQMAEKLWERSLQYVGKYIVS